MSAHINDLASAVLVCQAVAPATRTATFSGDTVDMIDADGACFAVQQIGDFEGTQSWAGRVEQSADGSAWSAIAGAAFAAVTAGENTQTIRFARTARYLRYAVTATGTSPEAPLAVLFGQVRKTF
jgi:hypothetical protein